jgi:hypothetical protein
MKYLILILILVLSGCAERKCMDGEFYHLADKVWVSNGHKCVSVELVDRSESRMIYLEEERQRLMVEVSECRSEPGVEQIMIADGNGNMSYVKICPEWQMCWSEWDKHKLNPNKVNSTR